MERHGDDDSRCTRLGKDLAPSALFLSSLLFSWLHETRNFMPLVFVLAVVGARHLTRQSTDERARAVGLE